MRKRSHKTTKVNVTRRIFGAIEVCQNAFAAGLCPSPELYLVWQCNAYKTVAHCN